MNKEEALEKSQISDDVIDSLIDSVFMKSEESPEGESLEKASGFDYPAEKRQPQSSMMKDGSSADDPNSPKTADEGEKPAKAKQEKEDENGRPKEVSDVPNNDEDGSRAKGYEHIQETQSKTPEISPKGTVVKSYQISEEDYEFLQKAKAAQKEEALQKAEQKQADLIKSIVDDAVNRVATAKDTEISELKKSLNETRDLVQTMANQPRQSKAVTNIEAIEKSFGDKGGDKAPKVEKLSKSQIMDVAEELALSGKITVEQAIELDDTGYIFDASARKVVEQACAAKYR